MTGGIKFRILPRLKGQRKKYELLEDLDYYSPRYGKYVFIDGGYRSDGATGAIDIASLSWWVHDKICDDRKWADGTPITKLQSSMVLYDILKQEDRRVRAPVWAFFTYLARLGERGWG